MNPGARFRIDSILTASNGGNSVKTIRSHMYGRGGTIISDDEQSFRTMVEKVNEDSLVCSVQLRRDTGGVSTGWISYRSEA
jgi:hypothetical protein